MIAKMGLLISHIVLSVMILAKDNILDNFHVKLVQLFFVELLLQNLNLHASLNLNVRLVKVCFFGIVA